VVWVRRCRVCVAGSEAFLQPQARPSSASRCAEHAQHTHLRHRRGGVHPLHHSGAAMPQRCWRCVLCVFSASRSRRQVVLGWYTPPQQVCRALLRAHTVPDTVHTHNTSPAQCTVHFTACRVHFAAQTQQAQCTCCIQCALRCTDTASRVHHPSPSPTLVTTLPHPSTPPTCLVVPPPALCAALPAAHHPVFGALSCLMPPPSPTPTQPTAPTPRCGDRLTVGMERMPKSVATCGLSSVFSFTHLTFSLYSAWISSSMGAIIWQGPHPARGQGRRGRAGEARAWFRPATPVPVGVPTHQAGAAAACCWPLQLLLLLLLLLLGCACVRACRWWAASRVSTRKHAEWGRHTARARTHARLPAWHPHSHGAQKSTSTGTCGGGSRQQRVRQRSRRFRRWAVLAQRGAKIACLRDTHRRLDDVLLERGVIHVRHGHPAHRAAPLLAGAGRCKHSGGGGG